MKVELPVVESTPELPCPGWSGGVRGLSYEEILRTLGTLLERQGHSHAVLTLSAEGVEVIAPNWRAPRRWTHESLQKESVAQRHSRYRHSPVSRLQPGGIAHRLRAVGIALDRTLHGDWYTVTVDTDRVHIRGQGYARTFDAAPLARRLALAPHLRGQDTYRRADAVSHGAI
jgi:hypothetical protein